MRRRQGFTLVELLVATALILLMMVVLAEAFEVGLDSFRRLKAVGDLNSRMRIAESTLRRDLTADHFEGKKRLSDATFWTNGPPREGFFRIWQGRPSVSEGNDGYAIPSTRASDHALHFTIKLRGNDRHEYLSAKVPAGSPLLALGATDSRYQDSPDTFNSQWAEVVYFLRPNGTFAGTTPLYALYRRQLLILPEHRDVHEINWGTRKVPVTELPTYREVSCKANPQDANHIYFNTPMDITVPQRRFGMDPNRDGGVPTVRPDPNDSRTWTYPTLGEQDPAMEGNDLLMTDVISFEVRVATSTSITDFADISTSSRNELFRDIPAVIRPPPGRPAQPRPHVFDTWSSVEDGAYNYERWSDSRSVTANPPTPSHAQLPMALSTRVFAVKITLRVWDVKTQQARQKTLIQDL